jgi:hypothetical protein
MEPRILMQEVLGLIIRLIGLYLISFELYNALYRVIESLPGVFWPYLLWCGVGVLVIALSGRIVKLVYISRSPP